MQFLPLLPLPTNAMGVPSAPPPLDTMPSRSVAAARVKALGGGAGWGLGAAEGERRGTGLRTVTEAPAAMVKARH